MELNESSKVVLKLSLGEGEQTQVHRIALSRLWVSNKVSYGRLMEVVKEYNRNSEEEWEVRITYSDEDGDIITIASDEELQDAFLQFVDKEPPVLRVKGHIQKSPKKAAPASSFRRKRRGGAKEGRTGPQIHALLESFVSVLATAVLALQEKVSHVHPPSSTSTTTTTTTTATTEQEEEAKRLARNALHKALQDTKQAEQLFVHGRHTCDGCLCTPIIGTRYHASNLPDYDLCAKCFANYKGDDIHFAPEVLERDRPMQQRWTRRHSKPRCASPRIMSFPGHYRQRVRQMQQHDRNFEDSLKEAIRQSLETIHHKKQQQDKQEKQQQEKQQEQEQEQQQTKEVEVDKASVASEQPFQNEPTLENNSATDTIATPQEPTTPQPLDTASTTTPAPQATTPTPPSPDRTSYSSEAKECGSIAEAIGETLDHVADAIDTIVHEFEHSHISMEQVLQDMDAASVLSDDYAEEEEKDDTISAMTSSLASITATPLSMGELLQETVQEEITVVPSVSTAEQPSVQEGATIVPLVSTTEQPSIQEGATIVSATEQPSIQEGATIVNSINTPSQPSAPQLSDDNTEADEWDVIDEVDQVQQQIANDDALARAATLIGSALFQSDLKDSLMGTPSPPPPQDKAVTAAVQQEAMAASEALAASQASTSVVSSAFSVDSIDSNLPSISSNAPLSSAVLTQWQTELTQLHELGFLDDKVNVDVLESLQAANIGAGVMEPVSVNEAVLRILNR